MGIKRDFSVALSSLSTFRMGGIAREVVTVASEAHIVELFQNIPENKGFFVLGGGSNVVFPDGECDSLIVRIAISGIMVEPDGTTIKIGAGENWDTIVQFAVEHGLSGIEALSAIPGSAGATPVQNVGAYGREIKDVLVSLRAYDIANKKIATFSNADCAFGYRDSFFKREGKGKYIITELTLALSKSAPDVPMYQGVAEYFASKEITRATLSEIRDSIVSIRSKKLPDPKDVASVGSFFKNPFVPIAQALSLKEKYPKLAVFPVNENISKIGAGSLIDALGWKGKSFGNLSIYEHNALVITNNGKGTFAELAVVVEEIKNAVQERFGIILEVEPEFVSFKALKL